jgi:cupin 2 domain-containing protein
VKHGNLFADAAPPSEGERFETLLNHRNLVIERIVSSEAITPTVSVQLQDEWVVLVSGDAILEVGGEEICLTAGDHLFLPAGSPHIVQSVSRGAIWLAVHLHPATDPAPDATSADASEADHPLG